MRISAPIRVASAVVTGFCRTAHCVASHAARLRERAHHSLHRRKHHSLHRRKHKPKPAPLPAQSAPTPPQLPPPLLLPPQPPLPQLPPLQLPPYPSLSESAPVVAPNAALTAIVNVAGSADEFAALNISGEEAAEEFVCAGSYLQVIALPLCDTLLHFSQNSSVVHSPRMTIRSLRIRRRRHRRHLRPRGCVQAILLTCLPLLTNCPVARRSIRFQRLCSSQTRARLALRREARLHQRSSRRRWRLADSRRPRSLPLRR